MEFVGFHFGRYNCCSVALGDNRSHMGGVMIWSPWLVSSGVHVGCVLDSYLFLQVYVIHSMGFFKLLSSCICTQRRVLGRYSYL